MILLANVEKCLPKVSEGVMIVDKSSDIIGTINIHQTTG